MLLPVNFRMNWKFVSRDASQGLELIIWHNSYVLYILRSSNGGLFGSKSLILEAENIFLYVKADF